MTVRRLTLTPSEVSTRAISNGMFCFGNVSKLLRHWRSAPLLLTHLSKAVLIYQQLHSMGREESQHPMPPRVSHCHTDSRIRTHHWNLCPEWRSRYGHDLRWIDDIRWVINSLSLFTQSTDRALGRLRKVNKLGPYGMFQRLAKEWGGQDSRSDANARVYTPSEVAYVLAHSPLLSR